MSCAARDALDASLNELSSLHDPYRQIFEAAGVGIARVSVAGRLDEVNHRYAEIVGRQRSDLIGLSVSDITHPDDLATDQAQTEATLSGAQGRYSIEKRHVRPDGQAVWVLLTAVLLRDDQGRPHQFIQVIEDISERLRMQAAMSSAQAAERASEAKTEFLSRMSHELRTPLNAMLGFAQLLRVDPRHPLVDAQRQKVAHIERAGAHLLAMLTDVLDLSRIEAGSLPMAIGPMAVHQALDEAVALVSNQATASQLSLQLTQPDTSLHVLADHTRLRQILVNLLSNAIKYNKAGGRVMIEALAVNGQVALAVSDTGQGLSPEQTQHLFEPFNRLGAERTPVEGTGIGLVIVKRLVDLMHGRIEVSSQPGVGSVFRVWLPQCDPVTPLQDGGPDSRPGRGGRSLFGQLDEGGLAPSLNLLYAEDNAVNVELVRQVLRMRPQWHLEVARSGREAVEMALSSPPDLLLLDMHLGDMSGLEVSDLLAFSPATTGIPRVALSADVMPDQIKEARQRGFADYLTKPLDVARLLHLLDHWAAVEAR
ncbi:ATP-binding protein [Aquabacterium sp.]|uniref:ATP-binding response regulator n=1 Tax=Aquabacterium sp. TaxID=1872578 RepID=UPI0025C56E35|nr:ATP-binding protein [Aquabacterium sp.]